MTFAARSNRVAAPQSYTRRCVATHGNVRSYQSGLANTARNIAIVLVRHGRQRRCDRGVPSRAIALYQALTLAEPNVPEYKYRLAQALSVEAVPLFGIGDLKGAIETSRLAVQHLEETLAAQPNVPTYQETLAISHNRLGILLQKAGDGPGASRHTVRRSRSAKPWSPRSPACRVPQRPGFQPREPGTDVERDKARARRRRSAAHGHQTRTDRVPVHAPGDRVPRDADHRLPGPVRLPARLGPRPRGRRGGPRAH